MERRQFLATTSVLLAAPQIVRAQAGQIPCEDFFRRSKYTNIKLSPDGAHIAGIVPFNGRRNLAVLDIATRKARIVTSMSEQDLGWYEWASDRRLVFGVYDSQSGTGEQTRSGGLFAVDVDGSNGKTLQEPGASLYRGPRQSSGRRFIAFFSTANTEDGPNASQEIIALGNERNAGYPDLYRLDTRTGRKTLLTFDTPGDVTQWIIDKERVPRAAVVSQNKGDRVQVYARTSENTPWVRLADYDPYEDAATAIVPVSFDFDGSLIVASLAGSDKTALYRYDVAAKKLGEKIVGHQDYDLGSGLIFDRSKRRLVGVSIEAEKPTTVWFDEDWSKWQKMIDQALPGRVNRMQKPPRSRVALVTSFSDRDPGTYYLFDPEKLQLEKVLEESDWLPRNQMAERQFIRYPARDGLSIPAYLTLPPGRPAKNLPLVVYVHGGPHVRGEVWHFDPVAQFLASRGYAVLQPDFRGSLGYGWKHYQAGWRQWGLAMQDDLNDGLEHLAKQGIVDRTRACIAGASYGGYAVMMGLARDPEVWRCGVNWVGVTDLELLQNATWSDTNSNPYWNAERFFDIHIGNLKNHGERVRQTSPLHLVDKIKRPVLMGYGGLDARVPVEHGTRMNNRLKERSVPTEFVIYDTEGHSWTRQESRVDFFTRVEKFLAQHLA